jgi:nicotinate-nucleotide pyrophosphorylase (carboxylating)
MNLDDKWLDNFIRQALEEDVGEGDHTSNACIPEDDVSTARLLVKDHGIIAGVDLAKKIFFHLDPEVVFHVKIPTART